MSPPVCRLASPHFRVRIDWLRRFQAVAQRHGRHNEPPAFREMDMMHDRKRARAKVVLQQLDPSIRGTLIDDD